jgi:phosphatidylserine/phosphatidylglycerophosphate/cardiolipin synthase-like enzyme
MLSRNRSDGVSHLGPIAFFNKVHCQQSSFDIHAVLVYGLYHQQRPRFRGVKSVTREGQSVKRSLTAFLFVVLLIPLQPGHATYLTLLKDTSIQVYCSPDGGCTDAINKILSQASQEIHVQAYSFTSAPIAKALLESYKRGVKVQVILDKSQKSEKYSSATFPKNAHIPTYIYANKHAITHNKIMIIDKATVINGSFNFTKAAEEKNAENVLIIRDKELTKIYIGNWENHKKHSEPQ